MPTCGFSTGFQLPTCNATIGGLNKIWLVPYTAATFTSNTTLNANDIIISITGATFYKFDLIQETSSEEESVKNNIQNNSSYYEGKVTLVIPKYDYTQRNRLYALASSICHMVTLSNSGTYKFWGATLGANVSEGKTGAGKGAGDFNGIELSFKTVEQYPAYIVTGSTAFTSSY